jgi:predicted transcriptional regulator
MNLKTEAMQLHQTGYSLDEIAEELGISESKTRELLGNDLHSDEAPKKSSKFAQQRAQNLQNRALNKLKEEFDELVAQAQELNSEDEISFTSGQEFLDNVRGLELDFRKVARQFNWQAENSDHREALLTLIGELKTKIKEWKDEIGEDDEEDYTFSLELEEDLLEQLDDLRFELVSFEAE